MAAFQGLRGTGAWTADERPKNWREMILLLFPNGEAPLTAILSKLRSQGTDDPEYNWWEKRLPTQRMIVNGAQTNVDTAIEVVSGAKDAVAGTLLMNERTGEIVKVSADPTLDTALTVVRAAAGVAMNDQDALVVTGSAYPEGASIPTAKSYSPVKLYNLTQIFRSSLSLTRTARKTRLRWDSSGPYQESKREALSLHSIEMEKAFLFGQKLETTGANGQPERQTGGILSFLTTNKAPNDAAFNVGGGLTEDALDALMEKVFRYGSTEKLALCGSTFVRAITTLAKNSGTINLVPEDRTYGLKVTEYISAFGTLNLKMHPLFNQHPVWRQNALILDVDNLVYRYIDDTMFIKNRQSPGDDLAKDEFLTECGLEVHMEETHAYITGVTGAA